MGLIAEELELAWLWRKGRDFVEMVMLDRFEGDVYCLKQGVYMDGYIHLSVLLKLVCVCWCLISSRSYQILVFNGLANTCIHKSNYDFISSAE